MCNTIISIVSMTEIFFSKVILIYSKKYIKNYIYRYKYFNRNKKNFIIIKEEKKIFINLLYNYLLLNGLTIILVAIINYKIKSY